MLEIQYHVLLLCVVARVPIFAQLDKDMEKSGPNRESEALFCRQASILWLRNVSGLPD